MLIQQNVSLGIEGLWLLGISGQANALTIQVSPGRKIGVWFGTIFCQTTLSLNRITQQPDYQNCAGT